MSAALFMNAIAHDPLLWTALGALTAFVVGLVAGRIWERYVWTGSAMTNERLAGRGACHLSRHPCFGSDYLVIRDFTRPTTAAVTRAYLDAWRARFPARENVDA